MSCEKINEICKTEEEEDKINMQSVPFVNLNVKKKQKNFRRREDSEDDTISSGQTGVKGDVEIPMVLHKGDNKIEFK